METRRNRLRTKDNSLQKMRPYPYKLAIHSMLSPHSPGKSVKMFVIRFKKHTILYCMETTELYQLKNLDVMETINDNLFHLIASILTYKLSGG
jgi:hypothetical protein